MLELGVGGGMAIEALLSEVFLYDVWVFAARNDQL